MLTDFQNSCSVDSLVNLQRSLHEFYDRLFSHACILSNRHKIIHFNCFSDNFVFIGATLPALRRERTAGNNAEIISHDRVQYTDHFKESMIQTDGVVGGYRRRAELAARGGLWRLGGQVRG